jgi:DNA polymerase-3 subunit delta'
MPFRDVVGHRRLIDLLSRSIAQESLPPSLLFAGPAGDVKRATAIAVAQTLNCTTHVVDGPWPIDACGACSVCARIGRGIHPDVLVVEPGDSGSIKIDQVRDVIERSTYRPFEGRRRVVIVDEADALVAAAQNALLKTLEEPPASSVFVLLTSKPDSLLPTVRSRLIRLTFAESGPADDDVEARDVAERVLARAAAGGDAGRRLDAAKDLLVNTGGGLGGDRDQLASHLRAIAVLLRDVEVVGTGADERLLAHADDKATLERLKRTFSGERGVQAFFAVDRGLAALERNAGVKIVADWVALQL